MFDFRRKPEWVSFQALHELKQHAVAEYPKESCGLILADGLYHPMENLHPEPTLHFTMDPRTFLRNDIKAVVHSHIGNKPYPSEIDMQRQFDTAVPWGITCTDGETATDPVWWGDQLPIAPLLERPFVPGIYDCWSLVRDWYRLNRNVTLMDTARDWAWWQAGHDATDEVVKASLFPQDIYGENYERAGFYRLSQNSVLEIGDIFLTRFRADRLNHAGVYIGEGKFLHHLAGQPSQPGNAQIWNHSSIDFWVRKKDETP